MPIRPAKKKMVKSDFAQNLETVSIVYLFIIFGIGGIAFYNEGVTDENLAFAWTLFKWSILGYLGMFISDKWPRKIQVTET